MGTGTLPTCTANPCTPLSLDAQYNVDDCADKVTAETCTVTCEAGYDGSALYTCGSDASFTGTLPTCTAIACTPLSLDAQYNVDDCADKVPAGRLMAPKARRLAVLTRHSPEPCRRAWESLAA